MTSLLYAPSLYPSWSSLKPLFFIAARTCSPFFPRLFIFRSSSARFTCLFLLPFFLDYYVFRDRFPSGRVDQFHHAHDGVHLHSIVLADGTSNFPLAARGCLSSPPRIGPAVTRTTDSSCRAGPSCFPPASYTNGRCPFIFSSTSLFRADWLCCAASCQPSAGFSSSPPPSPTAPQPVTTARFSFSSDHFPPLFPGYLSFFPDLGTSFFLFFTFYFDTILILF